jgi:hypothetical protein
MDIVPSPNASRESRTILPRRVPVPLCGIGGGNRAVPDAGKHAAAGFAEPVDLFFLVRGMAM